METLESALVRWLATKAKRYLSIPVLTNELIKFMNQKNMSIIRMGMGIETYHPQIEFLSFQWSYKGKSTSTVSDITFVNIVEHDFGKATVKEMLIQHGARKSQSFKNSPISIVLKTKKPVSIKILKNKEYKYPIVNDLKKLGGTDYMIFPLKIGDQPKGFLSLVTKRKGGFTKKQAKSLENFFAIYEEKIATQVYQIIAKTLLGVYLGKNTGERVLKGQIHRGNLEEIESAIWFSDIKNFTVASNKLKPQQLIQWLNTYFETIDEVVKKNGGEILKFIGDAILAIFPTNNDSPVQVCESALKAARLSQEKIKNTSLNGFPSIEHSIGLHFGKVQYGNIGSYDRLDFTVIGKEVNLASRIESLCKKLDQKVLISRDFSDHMENHLKFIGKFELKGIKEKQKIYTYDSIEGL